MSNKDMEREPKSTITKERLIKRLLILPQMIYDLDCSIEETRHELSSQINEREMLQNEFRSLQTISRLL